MHLQSTLDNKNQIRHKNIRSKGRNEKQLMVKIDNGEDPKVLEQFVNTTRHDHFHGNEENQFNRTKSSAMGETPTLISMMKHVKS